MLIGSDLITKKCRVGYAFANPPFNSIGLMLLVRYGLVLTHPTNYFLVINRPIMIPIQSGLEPPCVI
jgi:hypothetical protein